MPTFKLNGKAVDFRPGDMIIEAAARAGVSVPYYCYHPDMSRPANCRMCLVEMVGAPKLVTACSWPVNEKMEILTDSAKVRAAQANVMEFLLVNHPLDCPICDQAGECKLQQYSYLFGKPASAMEEEKVKLEKRKVLGPHVVLDQERCISCTRCVRFCDEVVGTGELAMVNRGNRSTVDVHEDRVLDNAYSGNVVDMCPVGALTNREFRFQARVWYLQATDTTCTLCAKGCNITVDWRGERSGLPDIKRIRARRNPDVNSSWICDEGRYGYLRVRQGQRPTVATGGEVGPAASRPFAEVDAAVAAAGKLLAQHAASRGWLGVLAAGSESNEELHALANLAKSADPDVALVVPAMKDEPEDQLLRRTDKSANQRGARLLGFKDDVSALHGRKVIVVADGDLRPDGGLQAEAMKVLARGAAWIALAVAQRPWIRGSRAFLPLADAYEKAGTIVNHAGVIQRLRMAVAPPGDCRPMQRHASDIAAAAGLPAIETEAEALLASLCAPSQAFHGLEPARLGRWGAKLPERKGEAATYLEGTPDLFTSAPKSYAEGEYLPFFTATTAPPAVHVAAGAPTLVRMTSGGTGHPMPPQAAAPAPEAGKPGPGA